MKTSKIFTVLALLAVAAISFGAQAAGFDVASFLTPDVALGLSAAGAAGMINYVQEGDTLDLLAPYAVSSGDGFQVGSIFAVAHGDAENGAAVRGAAEGVFTLAKTSAQAWTVGQKIYWDNSNKRCDSDGTLGMLIGVATAIAANPSSTGSVRLNGAAPSTAEGPQGALAALVDNSGGEVADGTIAVLVDAGGTAAGAPTTASVANAITELATRANAIRTALIAAGILAP
jgi:predicted RecA/RadA family phage recombinase